MRRLACIVVLVGSGCLEPLVSDQAGASVHVLPAGSSVPYVGTNADLTRQIRVNDGLNDMALEMAGGVVPLKSAWAGGVKISYWDFGDAASKGALLYVLVERKDDTEVPIAHPWILDSIPGDPGYSPFWLVQHVVVTDKYAGQLLTSAAAVADAVDLGLVEEPVPSQEMVDGPVVPMGTSLAMGEGATPMATTQAFAKGYVVDMLPIGGAAAVRHIDKPGKIPRGDVHRVFLGNAVNPSKDLIFQNGAAPWTASVRQIDCRVGPAADPMDPAAVLDDEKDLFARDDKGALTTATSRVMTWTITTSSKNWPVFVQGGTP